METFLSWSGPRSHMVADSLRKWLPGVLQSIDPWISNSDIEAGTRWHQALTIRLSECNFGIVCLTPENLGSPWLLYEAGALSKSVEQSSVVPYLLGLRKADVAGPLAYFQSVEADAEGTYALLQAMNAVMTRLGERPLPDEVLRRAFELWWPELREALQAALAHKVDSTSPTGARRSDEMIQELIENTRGIAAVVGVIAERFKSTMPEKPPVNKPLNAEPEVIEAARSALTTMVDELDADIPANSAMLNAITGWRSVASNPQSTLDSLNEAIKGAKGLRAYLDR